MAAVFLVGGFFQGFGRCPGTGCFLGRGDVGGTGLVPGAFGYDAGSDESEERRGQGQGDEHGQRDSSGTCQTHDGQEGKAGHGQGGQGDDDGQAGEQYRIS